MSSIGLVIFTWEHLYDKYHIFKIFSILGYKMIMPRRKSRTPKFSRRRKRSMNRSERRSRVGRKSRAGGKSGRMGRKARTSRTSRRNRVMGGGALDHQWQHQHFLDCVRTHDNEDERDKCILGYVPTVVPNLSKKSPPGRQLHKAVTSASISE
jgi:hypothetical protein